MIIQRSTIQLLRFHFSFFLMPVYWFALSQVVNPNTGRAVLIFFIIHLLIYPSSNGFNSYMDRDEGSIGGLKKPLQPTRQLLRVTILMYILAIVLGLFISTPFLVPSRISRCMSRCWASFLYPCWLADPTPWHKYISTMPMQKTGLKQSVPGLASGALLSSAGLCIYWPLPEWPFYSLHPLQ